MKGIWGVGEAAGGDSGSMAERGMTARSGGLQRVVRLGAAATAGGELANVVEEDGALEGVELRGEVRDLGDEGISHEDGGLIFMAGVRIAQEDGDVDLESVRETREGGQRGHGLAVLDLGDVGARHTHTSGELSLREITHVAQIPDGGGDLNVTFRDGHRGNEGERQWCGFGCFDLERSLAAGAGGGGTAELHKIAVVAAQDLTLFNRSHHGCHSFVVRGRLPERAPQHTSDNGSM